jgi:hypothetical protein
MLHQLLMLSILWLPEVEQVVVMVLEEVLVV